MADYKVTDTELAGIANAIRTKGGTSEPLVFPNGFTSAVSAIPSGGESSVLIEPSFQGLSYCYVGDTNLYQYSDKTNYIQIFELTNVNHVVLVKNDIIGDRCRGTFFLNKFMSDFEPYLNTPGSGGLAVSGDGIVMSYNNTLLHADIYARNNPMNGSIVMFTSSQGLESKGYCINLDLLLP